MNPELVSVRLLNETAKVPTKGTELSACYDIYACLHHERIKVHGRNETIKVENFGTDEAFIRLYPDDMVLVPTGLIFMLPPTHHLKFYSRSGNTWKRFLVVANQPAVIDSDYVVESFVLLHNKSQHPQIITNGIAIAQSELCVNTEVVFETINEDRYNSLVDDLKNKSSRNGGLGSTDKKM